MATFRVGQRVKYVSGILPRHPIGSEGTVVAVPAIELQSGDGGVSVKFDSDHAPGYSHVRSSSVVPLTDPKADAFIESLKKLKPYEEPKVLKERV